MDLQQEYFARHGFDTPAVCYPDNKGTYSIILKNLDATRLKQPRYIVLSVTLHKQETHPSYFKFAQQLPVHDGCGTTKNTWDKKVYYDEWDGFIRSWTESNKGELVPVGHDELMLAVMEMFMYSHDAWLAQNLHDRQKDSLFTMMDDSLPMAERLAVVPEVEEIVRGKNKTIAASLTALRGFGEGKLHASWLAGLLA